MKKILFNFVQYRRFYYLISALIIVPGVLAMIFSTVTTGAPIQLGIEFTGGSLFELQFVESVAEADIQASFASLELTDTVIQELNPIGEAAVSGSRWQVRSGFVDPAELETIKTTLSEFVAPLDEAATSVSQVSPIIGNEVTQSALVATVVSAVVILLFIMFAFRQVPNPIRYGICAISAMVHDILVVMSVMSILGLLAGWQADALFLTALLTVVGFSVQDSIVVFDRIRENSKRRRGEAYDILVNRSVLETIHRSLATQLNAFFIMAALLLFGGDTIKQFVAILFVGLLSGTYSSIFHAVPLLVSWEKGELPVVSRRRRQQLA